MSFNLSIMRNLISASLHQTYYEDAPFKTYQELYDNAAAVRKCLNPLYPLTKSEWNTIVAELKQYSPRLMLMTGSLPGR